MNNKVFYFLIISIFFCSCYNREKIVDKKDLLGTDFRLFQGTSVWELAKAVEDQDTFKIKNLVLESKLPIDIQDEVFGNSLLMLSVTNSLYLSTKTLLELGANPNLHDNCTGSTAVIDASNIDVYKDGRFLKLILKYGGDPNSTEDKPIKDSLSSRECSFALLEAAKENINLVKLLVEAGANVSQVDKFQQQTALGSAIVQDKFDIALYLLNKGADYKMKIQLTTQSVDILYLLRMSVFDLNSVDYKQKMKVVDFLKSKGLDYHNSPIPEQIINQLKKSHPNNWHEYLDKY